MPTITAITGSNLPWNDNATWVGGSVPTYGDTGVIPSASEVVISISSSVNVDLISVEGGGTLNITSSAFISTLISIEASGTLNVDGAGLSGDLDIAGSATFTSNTYLYGAITIQDGAVVLMDSGSGSTYGTITVGAASLDFRNGWSNGGDITLATGGTIMFSGTTMGGWNYGDIAAQPGSQIIWTGSGFQYQYGVCRGGDITIDNNTYNYGLLVAENGGTVTISGSGSTNGGSIVAEDGGQATIEDNASNSGTALAESGGTITFSNTYNYGLAMVESGGTVEFDASYNYGGVVAYQGAILIGIVSDDVLQPAKVKSREYPVVADVRAGEIYAGGQLGGLLDVFAEANLPAEADVRVGTNYGNSQTGTLGGGVVTITVE